MSEGEERWDIGYESGEELFHGAPGVAVNLGCAVAPNREADDRDDDKEYTDGEKANELDSSILFYF